jgi:hypothetical protein
MAALFPVSPLPAQTAPRPRQAGAQAIPDLSGIWEAAYVQTRKDICGEAACTALLGAPPPQRGIVLEEPQMLPWAEERYKAAREGIPNPNANGREEADPWFSACTPNSPVETMFDPFAAIELRQFPDVVLLLARDDHAVRRVYVDGRGHPPNWQPTWMGHSIGRYEGDTLIVDTVGFKGNRWLDSQGHPHSEALHLVERFRRVDAKTLEYEVSIEDPVAYKNSWRKKTVRELAAPGAQFWDEVNCSELLQMGTHFSAEAKQ